ncbi:MAG TPA: glycosyl hydrolase-related protein [Terriglobia bacterium]|nr:glycosyl hydrolase-related protein [Terriglobia bacterium]
MRKLSFLSVFLVLGWNATGDAKEQVLWQLGKIDHSEHEFAAPLNAADLSPVRVRIGESTAEKSWPRFHPGSGNGNMGGRARSYIIEFPVVGKPMGSYYLNLDLIFRNPRVPLMEVKINGHTGYVLFDPQPSHDLAEEADAFNPIHSTQHKRILLPPTFFHAGSNDLTLTCLDDPPVVTFNETSGGPGDSGLYYDAISLSQNPEEPWAAKTIATLKPTVFYRKGSIETREKCWVVLDVPSGWVGGKAKVVMGGFSGTVEIPGSIEFGETRAEILIPGSIPPGTARIELIPLAKTGGQKEKSFPVNFVPARRWKLYYAPHVHLDIGYTDYQAKIAEVHARNFDRLLEVLGNHPEYRFNIDGSFALEHWLSTRSAGQVSQLAKEACAGRVGLNAFYANFMTGVLSQEELFRGLYLGQQLQKRLGISADTAWATDVPSYSSALPSILAATGVRFFVAAANQTRGPMLAYGQWNHKSPFWWEGPDGKRVLAWYSYHYHQWRSLFGASPSLDSASDSLPIFLSPYERNDYKPDAVLVYGTDVDNVTANFLDADFVSQWNQKYEFPQIVPCRFSDFFDYIEKNFAQSLAIVRGDGGAYWEDGVGTIAQATSTYRQNQTRALAAESLSSLATFLDRRLRFPMELDLRIWRNLLLYGEHTITSYRGPMQPGHDEMTKQTQVKISRTTAASQGVDDLMRLGLSQLGEQIPTKGQNLVVYNPLSWSRSGLVQFELEDGLALLEVEKDQPVECEVAESGPGYKTIRFWAKDIPSLGYRVYRLVPGKPLSQTMQSNEKHVLENRYYRVTFDPEHGAISSLFDKELNRELVDASSSYRLNEYLYVSGGGSEADRGEGPDATQLTHLALSLPLAELQVHSAKEGRLVSVRQTPWGQVARLTARSVHTPAIESEILLPDQAKRIEIVNRVHKDLVYAKEAVYFAFPWAFSEPSFRFDSQLSWLNPERDLLAGADVEWFSPQNAVITSDGTAEGLVAGLDAPLYSLGDINRGRWPQTFTKSSAAVFSYAMNNYWFTNTPPGQSGDFQFRYVLTSARQFQPSQAEREGRQARIPLEIDHVRHFDKIADDVGNLPAGAASLASVEPDNLIINTLKVSEDEKGLIVRIYETAGSSGKGRLFLPFININSANEANALEVEGKPLTADAHQVQFHIEPHQVLTLRIAAK